MWKMRQHATIHRSFRYNVLWLDFFWPSVVAEYLSHDGKQKRLKGITGKRNGKGHSCSGRYAKVITIVQLSGDGLRLENATLTKANGVKTPRKVSVQDVDRDATGRPMKQGRPRNTV